MSNTLEFILKLTDMLTPKMVQASRVADTSAAKIQAQFDKIDRSGKRMGASVNELRSRLDAINKVRFSTTIQREFDVATKAAMKLERQIDRLENKGSKGAGGSMVGGFVKGGLITDIIKEVAQFAKDQAIDIYQKGLQNSSMRSALNATTGGQGNQVMSQTSAIANKYGLNYEASLEGVKTLTGGMKSMNLPLQEQMKIFEGVSTGMAAMKLDAETTKGAMLALGQMASKGNVQAEELRGQLGERIPGAFGIAAKAMNVTEAELNKMLQRGDVAAKDFLPRFAAEMQRTFGEEALKNANGPAAIQARFDNAIFKMKTSIGEGLMPLITPVIEKLTALVDMVLPPIQTGIQWLIDGFSSISTTTGGWSEYLSIASGVANSIWATIKSIFGNVWGIVQSFGQWLGKSEMMRDLASVIGKMWEGVLWIIRQIGDAIQWLWDNLIRPLLDKIEWVYSKIKGLFTGGKTEIVVTDGTKTAIQATKIPGGILQVPPDTKGVTPLDQAPKAPGIPAAPKNANLSEKASSINSGGQRSVTINVGKMIERIEMTVLDGKQGADEIVSLVRGEIRKVFAQIEATGA